MANYTQLIQALIVSVKQRITSKNTTDSIDPVDVGGSITDTLDTLLPILNTINNFDILKGNGTPTNGQGVDGDIYIQDGSIFAFYKKVNGAWVSKAVIDLGITFPDGNISLQSRIKQNIVTVSSGAWFIGNVKYQKSVQTQFTVPNADANFDRIDAIFANNSNNVVYVSGTASANPDTTQPTTPANTVLVNYVYVPKSSSNQLPYISDSNFQDDTPLVVTSSATDPIDGSDGDLYFQIPADNSFLKLWQKVSGTWQPIFDLPIGQGGGTSTVIHRSFTIPESDITDGLVSLTGRTNDQGDQIIPAKATWAVETEDGSVGRYSNATQTVDGLGSGGIEVYLVGVEASVPNPLTVINNTDKGMKYAVNSFILLDLPIGNSFNLNAGDSIILQFDFPSDFESVLVDQSSPLLNTDNDYYIDTNPRQWVIPTTSTSLQIEQSIG